MPEKYLVHYGIKGMKWGKRRFQNKDGSLTPAGRTRYGDDRFSGEDSGGSKTSYTNSTRQFGMHQGHVRRGAYNNYAAGQHVKGLQTAPKDKSYKYASSDNVKYNDKQDHSKEQPYYDYYRQQEANVNAVFDRQDKNFSSTTVKKQQSDRPRQAPGSETVHNTANPRDIQYRTNPERYGTFERGTNKGSYRDVTGPFRDGDERYKRDWASEEKRGLDPSKSGLADEHERDKRLRAAGVYGLSSYTPYVNGTKIIGSGGELYRDTVTGKQIMVPYGNNKRDNSGSSSENNPARYGTNPRPMDEEGYNIRKKYSGAFYKEGKYRVPALDASNNLGRGGEVYVNNRTGKETLLKPYGENGSRWTGKETSASSSRNNPARYGNFEQQKRDAARASKSKAGTKKSSLTTKAKQTISQATQQASQSVQKASDWLKKLFGKK